MVLQRYKRGQTHVSISNIDANVRSKKTDIVKLFEKWLREERYLFERRSQYNLDYLSTLNTMPPVHILVQKDRIDRIDLGTDVRLVNNEGQSVFLSMNKLKLKKALNSLQIELLQFPVLCTFRPSMENIERIQIRDFIYFDGLTKDRFFSTIHQVIRVYALISARLVELVNKRNNSN
jgi:hypothetical protein